MKHLYSIFRCPGFALLMLVSFLSSFTAAYAATSYTLTYASETTITEFSTCRIVTNNNEFQKSMFIGTKTAAEWQSFYEGPPPGVGAIACTIGAGNIMSTGLAVWGGLGDGVRTYTGVPTLLPATGSWKTTTWKKLSAGYMSTCGLLSDDTMRCWGHNNYGQIGDGTNISREFPTALGSGFTTTTWSDVSSSYYGTCAIRKTDSYLYCWGYNNFGQVGDGTITTRYLPTALAGGFATTAWKSVSMGINHVCAIRTSDSRIYCWGRDDMGMLGDGTATVVEQSTTPSTPTPLVGAFGTTAWSSLSAGAYHNCAIRTSDSRIYCWGRNYIGQAGNGTVVADIDGGEPTPVALAGAFATTAWKSVTGGTGHTCAIRTSDNTVFCWGHNGNGRLGNGNASHQYSPVALGGGFDTTAFSIVSAGEAATCAIRTSGSRLFCWGYGYYGTMGNGFYANNYTTPTDLTEQDGWDATVWKDISQGRHFSCGLRSDNTAACWGMGAYGQLSNGIFARIIPGGLTDEDGMNSTVWSAVSGGDMHACAIRGSDKALFCWGENNYGQLGAAATSGSFKPIPLTTTGGYNAMAWKQASAGGSFTCGVRNTDSTVHCWGYNADGRLGDGTIVNRTNPAPLAAPFAATAWESIAETSSSGHMCAIRTSDYRMYCWGSNVYGQLGVGTADLYLSDPTPLGGGFATTQWKSVAVGNRNTCALRRADSRMFCWGEGATYANASSDQTDKDIPTAINSTGGWDAVAWKSLTVSYRGGCAIRNADSYLFCWGSNGSGQIGDGTTSHRTAPTALTATGGFSTAAWKSVSATSLGYVCAVRQSDGRLFCWGNNSYGHFGTGDTTNTNAPVALTTTNGWNAAAFSMVSVASRNVYAIRQ